MLKKLTHILLIAFALALAGPAMAATVSFDATVDLDYSDVFQPGGVFAYNAGIGAVGTMPSKPVAVGDNVIITYTFGGRGVSARNVESAWAFVYSDNGFPAEKVTMEGTFSFLDEQGNVLRSIIVSPDAEVFYNIGQGLSSLTTGPITFFGVSYAGVVLAADPAITRTYSRGNLSLTGPDFVLVSATTPLPAALPLFASALGGIGFIGWRRRKIA